MTKLTREQVDQIADTLRGQCARSLEEVVKEDHGIDPDDLDIEDHLALDEKVFCCEKCGWYCDIDELSERADGNTLFCDECEDD